MFLNNILLFSKVAEDDGGRDIDFGDDGNISMEASITDDGIARGNDSFSALDHQPTRNAFTNELLEVCEKDN